MYIFRMTIVLMLLSGMLVQCKGNEGSKAIATVTDSLGKQAGRDTLIEAIPQPLSGIVFDSTAITGFLKTYPEFKSFANDIQVFYRNRSYNYAWFDQEGLTDPANMLLNKIQQETIDGIAVKAPYPDSLQNMFHTGDFTERPEHRKPDAYAELMLTGQYLLLAKKVWAGAYSKNLETIGWNVPRKKLSYYELLEKSMDAKNVHDIENEILNPEYLALRAALKKYQELEKQAPGSVSIGKLRKSLRPGDTSSVLPKVRQRLNLFGYLDEPNGGIEYDAALVPAVNRYKKSVGLKQDSLVTNEMLAALSIPVKKRIEQILVNLERFRWMPNHSKSDEFIFVNIPGYKLRYFENGKQVWDCNVVVGKTMNKTVIFSGMMQYVVMSPYWYVPQSIIQKEVKPGMKRNPNYLASHHMEWNGGNVRQTPGPHNSLGRVKFIFPNANNIYLHDTPSKSLFDKDARAFSHGCVRVSKPRDLALRILRNDPNWPPEKIDAAMAGTTEKTATLKKKIPVVIAYFTAFVESDGDVNFRDDVYQRDARLLKLISE
ncbi:L,D-transpeptidase family protein [Flavihumibacter fluvii]|uniref:L,D-transpeptidase family protein n=1 Tax=Flavihumibacter fluvii TaxID=2838157 RepID=UPI001BDE9B75|nr:L,D-transpeptidase family protein [Flavihumibacter fluvii]ULQ53338.1 L,D-transpeptidase family protein [Flavihumibacter fluvii]